MRLKILDRYLASYFGRMFLGVLLACAMLLVLTEVLDNFQDIANNECPLDKALLYFAAFLPYRLVQVLPLVSIVTVLFSIGILAHNREMLAITAAGLSPTRVAGPCIVAGAVISLAGLAVAELVVPHTETVARDIRKIYIEDNPARVLQTDVFSKGEGSRFYLLREFDSRKNEMLLPTVMDVSPETGRPVYRLTASRALLEEEATSQGQTLWVFDDAVEMRFNAKGALIETVRHAEPLRVAMEKDLHDYLASKRKPEEMGALELAGYIGMLEAHGEEAGLYRTDLWLKMLFPFASLLFVVSGFAFAMRAQVGSMVLGFAQGILFALCFYAFIALTQAMGHRGVLPPWLAVLVPMAVGGWLAVRLLRRSAYTMT